RPTGNDGRDALLHGRGGRRDRDRVGRCGRRRRTAFQPKQDRQTRDVKQLHWNSFFHWRIAANTAASSCSAPPPWVRTARATPGRRVRRKGLIRFSRSMVDGRVGRFWARSSSQRWV